MSQTIPNDSPASRRDRAENSPLHILASGGIGAFCFSIADLINNDGASALVKVGEAMRRLSVSWVPAELIALIVLTSLGFLLCWIYQPKTRLDAFMRGFSVFAIFTVASPYENAALKTDSMDQAMTAPVTRPSTTNVATSTPPSQTSAPKTRGVLSARISAEPELVLLSAKDRSTPVTGAIVTLRDPKTGRIISKFRSNGRFRLPAAKPYLIEIEASGYRLSMWS